MPNDPLPGLLRAVYRGEVTVSTAVSAIRREHYPRLVRGGDVSVLDRRVRGPWRTVRGMMWAVILSPAGYAGASAREAAERLGAVGAHTVEREFSRAERFVTCDARVGADEYRSWLLLSAGARGGPLDQNLGVFGAILLRNLGLVASCQAFESFVRPIGHLYGATVAALRDLGRHAVRLVATRDPALAAFLDARSGADVIAFPHVASLFTQMAPHEGVERLWDLLVVYGPHFAVYVEAAWLIAHRAELLEGRNPADRALAGRFRIDGALELLVAAVRLHAATEGTVRSNIERIVYGDAD